jgi:hypothetical protein
MGAGHEAIAIIRPPRLKRKRGAGSARRGLGRTDAESRLGAMMANMAASDRRGMRLILRLVIARHPCEDDGTSARR